MTKRVVRKSRAGYGLKDGSGRKAGGRGRNRRTASTCRHPNLRKSR